jgi:ComF family protein
MLYPHNCLGCGSDVLSTGNLLCLECIGNLPHTGFALHANNPVEKIFWGRLPVTAGMSEFYFSKESIIQNCIHEFKYRGNRKIGLFLGNLMAKSLLGSNRFSSVDVMVPLPLFLQKEYKRGYNQAAVLCEGIHQVMDIPVIAKNVARVLHTDTQTRKGRTERWENVAESFAVTLPESLEGKHVLLVDDVVTTGATLEACGVAILKVPGTMLSIATLAIATR